MNETTAKRRMVSQENTEGEELEEEAYLKYSPTIGRYILEMIDHQGPVVYKDEKGRLYFKKVQPREYCRLKLGAKWTLEIGQWKTLDEIYGLVVREKITSANEEEGDAGENYQELVNTGHGVNQINGVKGILERNGEGYPVN